MNSNLIYLLFLLVLISGCKTQSDNPLDNEDSVENIMYQNAISYMKSIDNSENLDSIVLDGEDYLEFNTDNGAELTGFYKDNSLIKITENLGLSLGFVNTDYYQKDGNLYVVKESESVFPEMKDENGNISGLDYSKLENNYNRITIYEGSISLDTLINGEKKVSTRNSDHKSTFDNLAIALEDFKINSEQNKLIQGRWKSATDDLLINEFDGQMIKEIYDGELMTEQSFSIKGDRLIYSDDLNYSIVKLDSDSLILIYPDRGNTLKYFKLK